MRRKNRVVGGAAPLGAVAGAALSGGTTMGSDGCVTRVDGSRLPDPTCGTTAIVDVAKVRQAGPMVAGRRNTFHISARGEQLTVVFNGETTADVKNGKWQSGPAALGSAAGTIPLRKVQIRVP